MPSKPFIVAEISANHLGSIERAAKLVHAAKVAGADAVKFQTFTPERMAAPDLVIQDGPWAGRRAVELYREAHMPRSWHQALFDLARVKGLEAFSSAFHPDDVDFLETLGCPRYKIASFELTDHALIRHAAATGKPIIISTGMASFDEIVEAKSAAQYAGCGDVTLLKCTSAYPAEERDANLATMAHLRAFLPSCKVGLSDHSMGLGVPAAAAALGACMIEKHLTLSRADGGPDAGFSLEPHEFSLMVKTVREVALSIGEVKYGQSESERPHLALRGRTLKI